MFTRIFICFFIVTCFTTVGSAGTKELKDLSYYSESELAAGDDYMRSQCVVDLKYPEGETGWPVFVWFHGGGLTAGRRNYLRLPTNIAVVAVEYRLSPKVELPVFIEDAAAATAWVFKNIEAYGGDPKKIFIAGGSAGGYLSAMVGMDPKWLAKHDIDHKKLAGIIPISGQVTTHFRVKQLMGDTGHQYRPLIDEYAPLYYCAPNLSPICIITGDRALEWKCRVEENELLAVSLKNVGTNIVEFHELAGLNHSTVYAGSVEVISGFIKRTLGED